MRNLLEHLAPAQRAELIREIESVRQHKVAISAQVVDGIRTVAVPVFDHETAAATLAFVGTTAGIPADPNSGLVAALREKRRHGFRANSATPAASRLRSAHRN